MKNNHNICADALDCENGMKCAGEQNLPCETPCYPPIKDYVRRERNLERRLLSIFYVLEPEEMACLKALAKKGWRLRQELAGQAAEKLLKEKGRRICRRDVEESLDQSVMNGVRNFNRSPNPLNAAWLQAVIDCRDKLLNSLPEDSEADENGGGDE